MEKNSSEKPIDRALNPCTGHTCAHSAQDGLSHSWFPASHELPGAATTPAADSLERTSFSSLLLPITNSHQQTAESSSSSCETSALVKVSYTTYDPDIWRKCVTVWPVNSTKPRNGAARILQIPTTLQYSVKSVLNFSSILPPNRCNSWAYFRTLFQWWFWSMKGTVLLGWVWDVSRSRSKAWFPSPGESGLFSLLASLLHVSNSTASSASRKIPREHKGVNKQEGIITPWGLCMQTH